MVNSEQFKVLSGILALREFTAADLVEETGVKPNTIHSWLRRTFAKGELIEEAGITTPDGRKPRKVWRLRKDATERLRNALDEINLTTRPVSGSTQEAMAAFEDEDIRLMVRRHLLLASRAQDEETRSDELDEAKDWLAYERDRLSGWVEDGFECPEKIRKEIALLEMWMQGLDLRVDRLGFEQKCWDVEHIADWMTEAVSNWFSTALQQGPNSFSPLALSVSADLDRRENLVRQIMIVLRTAEHVATIPLDRLLCAILMTFPRLTEPNARDAICDILEEIGFDRIGFVLQHRISNAQDNLGERRFTLHVLEALERFPQLLQNERVGAWFDSLPYSRLWVSSYANAYITALQHRPNADLMRALNEKADELDGQRMRYITPDEELQRETQGLSLNFNAIADRIERWLGNLAQWRQTREDYIGNSWAQRFSRAA